MCFIHVVIHFAVQLFNICGEAFIQMVQYVWLYHIHCNFNVVQRNRNHCNCKKRTASARQRILLICVVFREFVVYTIL